CILNFILQVSAFLAGLFHSGLIQRVLVIAPKTLLTHWIKELTVVGLRHMISDYSGSNLDARDFELQHAFKEGGILLTTYDIARINYRLIRGDFYNDADDEEEGKIWNYVILDEAHFIKNPKTRRAQSLFEIPCVHRIAISGTPVQNNLKVQNIELRERIKPYFLRRMKNVVSLETGLTDDKQLPKKNELIIWLKLTDCQRQLYKAFLNSELVHLASQGNPLAALTVLKKICDHPLILTKRAAEDILEGMDGMSNNQDMLMAENMAMNLADMAHADDALQAGQEVSCKLSFIMSLLRNLLEEGHHILIFSQTRKMLNLIQVCCQLLFVLE
uniref:Helicase ATP-binding domain-containing protein n=1 Tax=Aegilops tauschii subsp. strangulata TaxID=200361 RepID=A0A452Z5D9_AEGTS